MMPFCRSSSSARIASLMACMVVLVAAPAHAQDAAAAADTPADVATDPVAEADALMQKRGLKILNAP